MDYDVIILGAGAGGYKAAVHLLKNKKRVLMIEKEKFGGECLNYGCIPSKALIEMSESIYYLKNMPGISMEYKIDMKAWQDWKNSMVARITGNAERQCKSLGADILYGFGTLKDKNTVNVNGKDYTAENIIIDTGSSPARIPGIDNVYYNREILGIDHIPESIAIIGGGYIGVEIGTAMAKLGSDVYIIEAKERILPEVSSELSNAVDKKLRSIGVKIMTSSKVISVSKDKYYTVKTENDEIKSEMVLMSVGRIPNTKNIGLENLKIEMDGRFIKTDEHRRTNVKNIYAIGDVTTGPMLAHKAFYDAYIASENILGNDVIIDYKAMPYVIYTDPEISFTGSVSNNSKKIMTSAVPRALTMNEGDGFFRIYYNDDGTVTGAAIAAPRSSEIITEISLAVESYLNINDLLLTIHPHPTIAEGIHDDFEN
ncbi:FAD-dependent oxidoreductase [Picrophilus oshimae]|uniref:Dihydrolipoamide dehydrogenase n=1 Tax=Picrophilus torridus (strain ATCC 700027 / DSM 9790 / JCM 10055 / NBRC 100828 / KAW 2/3) TaxID=1122961 RepID=Q6L1M1_PICTO|nr:FAD-dependent oxidoreductase [Picrophilus oshimae]AAT43131.1 dihydrolipoamide dehydrogenase [Picrophilus oshimae DSM 9789]SMD30561.1 dihydrolipoamide dehydrogenase [Picrophilus oshimae DSM 9789]